MCSGFEGNPSDRAVSRIDPGEVHMIGIFVLITWMAIAFAAAILAKYFLLGAIKEDDPHQIHFGIGA
ncbi:hypothetical protein N9L26_00775 [Candidatus Pacebacteria bacterium]|nr:hypothetical protein [Candidatus Paceibacterota bacterium]